ncbi:hypothetical protein SDRG_07265 [Saprolegnia diclina VS20]|uniref:Uncharacterized protein n=1 Tax=Saprolegnia diclina (strain VS20) TaxID=1156394 RepID=T0QMJ5_SAPDV|nr:hypothetical protein SDRG_07265 [Saprolegnia diclina VS20]EQC35025.1 hypothetical protein SDRG_07265 [Saprolegnia diclina VS20]|eukprot:XP_008611309.1 hypothetical protein SDRG_07265 [Saprolegnia diclina VS20]
MSSSKHLQRNNAVLNLAALAPTVEPLTKQPDCMDFDIWRQVLESPEMHPVSSAVPILRMPTTSRMRHESAMEKLQRQFVDASCPRSSTV